MSEYDLIPDEAYENLPQDPGDQFAALVRIAQTNLSRLLDQANSGDFAVEIRSQFMSIVSGIADALGVQGVPPLSGNLSSYDEYQKYQVYLAGVVAKVRLQSQLIAKPYSVQLGRVTRAKIQQDIDQLRFSISSSDLSDKKKASLSDKLSELEEELTKQRLSFARTMSIAASIAAIIGSGTAAIADLPKATEVVVHIIQLIGEDKAKEEEERLRLMPPPKALPDYSAQNSPQRVPVPSFDLDDDLPF